MDWIKTVVVLTTLFLLVLTVLGCEQRIVCNEPYITKGTECCLDRNENKICDEDERVEINHNQLSTEEGNLPNVEILFDKEYEIDFNLTTEVYPWGIDTAKNVKVFAKNNGDKPVLVALKCKDSDSIRNDYVSCGLGGDVVEPHTGKYLELEFNIGPAPGMYTENVEVTLHPSTQLRNETYWQAFIDDKFEGRKLAEHTVKITAICSDKCCESGMYNNQDCSWKEYVQKPGGNE